MIPMSTVVGDQSQALLCSNQRRHVVRVWQYIVVVDIRDHTLETDESAVVSKDRSSFKSKVLFIEISVETQHFGLPFDAEWHILQS